MVGGVREHTTFLRRGWKGDAALPVSDREGLATFRMPGVGGKEGGAHVKYLQTKIIGDQIRVHTGAPEAYVGAVGAQFRCACSGPPPTCSET